MRTREEIRVCVGVVGVGVGVARWIAFLHTPTQLPLISLSHARHSLSNSALLSRTHPSDSYSPLLGRVEGPQHRLFSGRSNSDCVSRRPAIAAYTPPRQEP